MVFLKNVYKIKNLYGKDWLQIFYQNTKNKNLFKSDEEANYTIPKNGIIKDKFSIIKYIDYDFSFYNNIYQDNYFEFLLEYPDINFDMYWMQKYPPYINANDVGMIPNGINSSIGSFRGLAYGNLERYTFLDGTSDNVTWVYCIGMKDKHNGGYKIPGPIINGYRKEFVFDNGTK